MLAVKQGVSTMHDLICNACMHDARAMHQVANISQVMYNIHPSNLIPPTHVFNGKFLSLGFWSGPQYQQGILSTDEHANLSKQ